MSFKSHQVQQKVLHPIFDQRFQLLKKPKKENSALFNLTKSKKSDIPSINHFSKAEIINSHLDDDGKER